MDDWKRHPSHERRIPSIWSSPMPADSSKEASPTENKEPLTEPIAACSSAEDSPNKSKKKIKQVFHYYFKRKFPSKSTASPSQRSIVSGTSFASGVSSVVHRLVTGKGSCKRDLVIENPWCMSSVESVPALTVQPAGSDTADDDAIAALVTASFEDLSSKLTKLSSQCSPRGIEQRSRLQKRSTTIGALREVSADVPNLLAESANCVTLVENETVREIAQAYPRIAQARKITERDRKNCEVQKQTSRNEISAKASSSHTVSCGPRESTDNVVKEAAPRGSKVIRTSCLPAWPECRQKKYQLMVPSKQSDKNVETKKSSKQEPEVTKPEDTSTSPTSPVLGGCEMNEKTEVSHNGCKVIGDFINVTQTAPMNLSRRSRTPSASQEFLTESAIDEEWVALLAGDETNFSEDTASYVAELQPTVSSKGTAKYIQLKQNLQAALQDSQMPITVRTPLAAFDQPDLKNEGTGEHLEGTTTAEVTTTEKIATSEPTDFDKRKRFDKSLNTRTCRDSRRPSFCDGFDAQQLDSCVKMPDIVQGGNSWQSVLSDGNLTTKKMVVRPYPEGPTSVIYRDGRTSIGDPNSVPVFTVLPVSRTKSSTKYGVMRYKVNGKAVSLFGSKPTEANSAPQHPATIASGPKLDSAEEPYEVALNARDFRANLCVGGTIKKQTLGGIDSKFELSGTSALKLSTFEDFNAILPDQRYSRFARIHRLRRWEDTHAGEPPAKHLIGVKKCRPRLRFHYRPKVNLSFLGALKKEACTKPDARASSTQTDASRSECGRSQFTQTFDGAQQRAVLIPPNASLNFGIILMVIAHCLGAWLFNNVI